MNKRQRQKQRTRSHILGVAKELFINKGFLSTTTSDIAKSSGIAHGTLFLHFPTKDNLILEIFDNDLAAITNQIEEMLSETDDLYSILLCYLDSIEKDEALFSVLARELPFYSEELRRKIIFRESLIRKHFYKAMEHGIKKGIYRRCDIPITLNFFFGSVNYYLSLKELYTEEGTLFRRLKGKIVENFLNLIKEEPADQLKEEI